MQHLPQAICAAAQARLAEGMFPGRRREIEHMVHDKVHEVVAGIRFEDDPPTPPGDRELWRAGDDEED